MKQLFIIALVFFKITPIIAQLPSTFITKVSFREHIEVSYEMVDEPDSNGISCLTLAELAQYHFMEEESNHTEIIDEEGDLLFEKEFLIQKDIRDEWMPDYGKIISDKQDIKVFSEGGELIYTKERVIDSNSVYLTAEQAINYQYYALDHLFYENIKNELDSLEVPYSDSLNIITAVTPYQSMVYDDNIKVFLYTEYDSSFYKLKETAIEYDYTADSAGYAPVTETIIEWLITENGCCLKKTTVIHRYGFLREVNPLYLSLRSNPGKKESKNPDATPELHIAYVNGQNAVMLITPNETETYVMNIYNINGQLIVNKQVKNGEKVPLPNEARAGMYLIHIQTKDGQIKTGKIIKASNNNSF